MQKSDDSEAHGNDVDLEWAPIMAYVRMLYCADHTLHTILQISIDLRRGSGLMLVEYARAVALTHAQAPCEGFQR